MPSPLSWPDQHLCALTEQQKQLGEIIRSTAVGEKRRKSIFWSDLLLAREPPSGTELSNGQAAKLAVKDMMDDRPRMYDSPPTTYTYQQIVRGPFRKNAFSHSIISVHSQRAALSGAFIYQRWSHDSAEFCSEWSSVLQLNKTWQHQAGNLESILL